MLIISGHKGNSNQIKTTLRLYLTPVRMTIIKNTTNKKCGEKGTLMHFWWECKLVKPLWKTVWRLLKKLNIDLPYDPAIPLLGIFLKNVTQIISKAPAHTYVYGSIIRNNQAMETAKMPHS
jgi:hypothetical protein